MIVLRRTGTGETRRISLPITPAEAAALVADGLIEAAFPTLDEIEVAEHPAEPRAQDLTALAA